jgi:predicted DNA-binding transcriptional regulator YafY
MPKNKQSLIRYRVINRCLQDGRRVTLKELKSACERALDIYPLGERTIEEDIRAMRKDSALGYNAPIKVDRREGVYYYEDPAYSIDQIPLNDEELESILFAAKLLSQYDHIPIFNTFNESVQKLVDAVNVYRLTNEDADRSFIEFERSEATKGSEFLEPLINAIKNRNVLKLTYKAFTAKGKTYHIIHPYLLKEYRNRWFLICYHQKHKGIRTFGLDRIKTVDIESGINFQDIGFDATKYYKNVIGISVIGESPVEIHLGFTELQAEYILSQPFHESQEFLMRKNQWKVFRYYLVPNYEFYAQILAWGNEVKIFQPISIQNQIKVVAKNIITNYVQL